MLDRFAYAAKNLNRIAGNKNYFSQVLIAAKQSEKFGVENVFEGSSNMVDFIGFSMFSSIVEFPAIFGRRD